MTGRFLIFAVTLLGLSHGGVLAQVSDVERQALIDLYHQTGGDDWSNNQGWLGPPGTECNWAGLSCNPGGGVRLIYLANNNLAGPISDAIFRFPSLIRAGLAGNELTGPLPDLVMASSTLELLELADNQLTGEVPESFALLELKRIDVSGNQLEGTIDNILKALRSGSASRVSFNISDNLFVDPIPSSIAYINFLGGSSDMCGNRFEFSDPALDETLARIQHGGNPQLCNLVDPADITLTVSGTWYVPERSGEGYSLMATDDGSLLAFWFGYPQPSMPGDQHWQMGQTELTPGRIDLPEMMLHQHGHIALGAESMLLNYPNMHEFSGMDNGDLVLFATWQHLWWNGILPSPPPPPYSDREQFKRLSQLAGTTCQNQQPHQWISGVWYDPSRVGEGFVVEVLEDGIGLVYWFTYTPGNEQEPGMQAWMTGMGQFTGTTLTIDDLMQPMGGGFRPEFQPDHVQLKHWGDLTLQFDDADHGRVDFNSVFEDYGSGGYPIVRLARPLLADCGPSLP